MSALQREVDAAAAYISANTAFVSDARKRSEVESRLEKLNAEVATLREIQQRWPRNEEQMKRLHDDVEALRDQYRALQAEQRQTEQYLSQQALHETFEKAQREHDRLMEEERRLTTLRGFGERDIKSLKEAEAAIKSLLIKVESQKLALRVEARKPFTARLRTTAGERDLSVKPGENISETTKGSFELTHADWTLGVRSATDDALALQHALEDQNERYAELCRKLSVVNSEEAAALQKSFEEQKGRVDKAKSALQALLGKESYETMAQRMLELGAVAPGRSVSTISELMKQVTEQGANKSREEKDLQRQCKEWADRYTDHDQLLDLLLRYKQEATDLERQAKALAPLPSGVQDAAAYVVDFDRKKEEQLAKKEKLNALLLERAAFEKNEPDEALEELEDSLNDVRVAFGTARAEGEAYARIREELEKLVGSLDAQAYKPLQDRFEQLVDQLTLHRYRGLQMEGPLPVRIKGDDKAFTLNMLSQGTLDILALAVRVGMADYYLDKSDGFIVMDDPLVNLDPERQKAAVACLQEFAGRKQAIVLTCHPSHAELLGGNLIQL
jgi:exonuclease SbcC